MVVYTVFLDKVCVAVHFRIPSASISKVSSNFTSPLGAGVRPLRNISPRKWLSLATGLSPSQI